MSTAVRSRLFSEPIDVIVVAETVSAAGRVTKSETSTQVRGAFRQRVAVDAFNDGVVVSDEVAVYLPPDTLVGIGDALAIRGQRYEVVSTAFPQVNFRTTEVHHIEVRARRSQR
jgi:hypothetical protein